MNKGFTLLELLIVLGILGIIAAIGVPQYIGYADSSRLTTVRNNLRNIHMQQQEFYHRNNAYYSTGAVCANNTAAINTNLFGGQNIIVNDRFTYCITQTTVDNFTARATEDVPTSPRTITINQLNQTTGF